MHIPENNESKEIDENLPITSRNEDELEMLLKSQAMMESELIGSRKRLQETTLKLQEVMAEYQDMSPLK